MERSSLGLVRNGGGKGRLWSFGLVSSNVFLLTEDPVHLGEENLRSICVDMRQACEISPEDGVWQQMGAGTPLLAYSPETRTVITGRYAGVRTRPKLLGPAAALLRLEGGLSRMFTDEGTLEREGDASIALREGVFVGLLGEGWEKGGSGVTFV